MLNLAELNTTVIGLDRHGVAAAEFLARRGARVVALDAADTRDLRATASYLESRGVVVHLGPGIPPLPDPAVAVVTPAVSLTSPLVAPLRARGVKVISELELGYQQSLCPNISVTGTNGKTTTLELIERILRSSGRTTTVAGHSGVPLTSVVDQTRELDFLTLEASSAQLESIEFFRPAVAVLLNVTRDHLDRHASMDEYLRAKARLFANQQIFDWAIVQTEALAQLRAQQVAIPAKLITFSTRSRQADLFYDRGLLVSRLEGWEGPLLDMDHLALRGVHNAENLLAALAVGRVLRLPLEAMLSALKDYRPGPHRCETIAEVDGIRFVDDSKSTNLDATMRAIEAMPGGRLPGEPNVWLIAGGRDKAGGYHDLGPLLSRRVKGTFLIGEAREMIRAAWSLFTPCAPCGSLLEAVGEAARSAVSGDVVLLSPACSSFDQFQSYQHRGDVFRAAVRQWTASREVSPPGGGVVDDPAAGQPSGPVPEG